MESTKRELWAPYWFAVALSLICLIALIGGQFWTGSDTVWVIPFLGFFPHSFLLLALTQKRGQERIRSLEDRIQLLESQRTAA